MKSLVTGLFCLLTLSCTHEEYGQNNEALTFSSATVRALLPGKTTTVAFATINNHTDQAITLISATSAKAGKIDFHTHIHDGNLVKMRQLPNLLIPANDSLVLMTGAVHLMLFGVEELGKGMKIHFTTQSGSSYEAAFDATSL